MRPVSVIPAYVHRNSLQPVCRKQQRVLRKPHQYQSRLLQLCPPSCSLRQEQSQKQVVSQQPVVDSLPTASQSPADFSQKAYSIRKVRTRQVFFPREPAGKPVSRPSQQQFFQPRLPANRESSSGDFSTIAISSISSRFAEAARQPFAALVHPVLIPLAPV